MKKRRPSLTPRSAALLLLLALLSASPAPCRCIRGIFAPLLRPPPSPTAGSLAQSAFSLPPPSLSSSSTTMTALRAFRWSSSLSTNPDPDAAVREVVSDAREAGSLPPSASAESSEEEVPAGLALLFVGQSHASRFSSIARDVHLALGGDDVGGEGRMTTVAVVGGGVVGGGVELDDPRGGPALSLLVGTLPEGAKAGTFKLGGEEVIPSPSSDVWRSLGGIDDSEDDEDEDDERPPSYLLFADPWSPIDAVLERIDKSATSPPSPSLDGGGNGAIVAGGISCPVAETSTIAVNGRTIPRGSVAGVRLGGTLGLQAAVAQGSRAVGPTFDVTAAQGNVLTELNGEPALLQLQKVVEEASEEDKVLINSGGLLCGVFSPPDNDEAETIDEEMDFLVRQVMGLVPNVGGIVVGAAQLRPGDAFRFHVRDASAAREDLGRMVQRAEAERLFAGPRRAGTPVAAVQVSCVARGRSLFGEEGVDLKGLSKLVEHGNNGEKAGKPAVAGFFANGEMGPVGLAGFGKVGKRTHIHGFTTVMAMLCDFSEKSASASDVFDDMEAWG